MEIEVKVFGVLFPSPGRHGPWAQHFCSLSLGINKASVDKSITRSNVRSDPFLRPHDLTFGFTTGREGEREAIAQAHSNSQRRLDDCTSTVVFAINRLHPPQDREDDGMDLELISLRLAAASPCRVGRPSPHCFRLAIAIDFQSTLEEEKERSSHSGSWLLDSQRQGERASVSSG